MILEELHLENYRGFEDCTVQFDEKMNVFVGANGMGKTAVLDAAAVALGAFTQKLDHADGRSIIHSDARVVSYQLGDSFDSQPQYPVLVSARARLFGETISWHRELRGHKGRMANAGSKEIFKRATWAQDAIRSGSKDLILPTIVYYGTGRLWQVERSSANIGNMHPSSRTLGYKDCLSARPSSRLMNEWFIKMDYRSRRGEAPVAYTAVKQAICRCLSSGIENADFDVLPNLETGELDVAMCVKNGECVTLPARSLSDGYKNVLGIVADIAYRMATLNPMLGKDVLEDTPGVVLIDEVDLHLHPLWQARILGDLKSTFPKVQFIVTTHAPTVIASVRKEHIRIIEREGIRLSASETYGRRPGDIMQQVMGANDRPEEVRGLFDSFYKALDLGDYEHAEGFLEKIENQIGDVDPDLTAARTALTLERI